jgi:hypothetical protein
MTSATRHAQRCEHDGLSDSSCSPARPCGAALALPQIPPVAAAHESAVLAAKQVRRDPSSRDPERRCDLSRPRSRVLGQKRRNVVLGYLPGRSLAENRRPGSSQPFALRQQLFVTRKLLVEALQPLVDLSDDAARSPADCATRIPGHERPPRQQTSATKSKTTHVAHSCQEIIILHIM